MNSKNPSVEIGIHITEDPLRLRNTLAALSALEGRAYELCLLADGPDPIVREELERWNSLRQSVSAQPLGAPACFNRLVSGGRAEICIFLESGAQVTPDWLDHLLGALAAHPRNGLAGPSTNRCWNAQAVFQGTGDSLAEVAQCSREALRRFGIQARTLDPLYSLADFCYAVRREVIQDIGLADEDYGLGPCWEMDYNIRAARAGWRGVWACAAYVHRAPFTIRRQRDEARLFESSKRRYQDKFCGARLRGEKTDYRLHCRGDACPNFAPADLIRISDRPTLSPSLAQTATAPPPPAIIQVAGEQSLVSCIMPTCDRHEFVREAVRCFLRQDYPNLELVIVDDGTEPVAPILPNDTRLRTIRLAKKENVGTKRNIACASALGKFILHWDDDDWYPPDRVSRQIAALHAEHLQICGTSTLFYYDSAARRAWRYRYSGGGRPWVAGNTLAYRKSWWIEHPFPGIQIGEDSRFVWAAPFGSVCDLAAPELCVSRIHGGNTSRKLTSGSYWQECVVAELESLLGNEWPWFLSAGGSQQGSPETPLVSCIMPTFNRRPFVQLALESFSRQNYAAKELIVVDDGTDAVGDLVEGFSGVQYLRLPIRCSIGEKRNRACAAAKGAIIAHWDDDDWYAPGRLRHQIVPLLSRQADLTGLENSLLLELPTGQFWRTRPGLHQRMFMGDVHGGTLVYWKQLIVEGLRYPAISLAEDAAFILAALRSRKRLLRLPNDGIFVYVRHGNNAWQFQPGDFLDPAGWEMISPQVFPTERLSAYRRAATAHTPAIPAKTPVLR